jgi:hypothetical protein
LGNWVHDQRKKFKAGTLSDDRITLLSDLEFDFLMQTNVVEQKLTVPMAISRIFKYKKEHGNVSVPNREPHKQLRRWILHAKATSKKIIAQGSGNPKFTLPNLKLLHELRIIQLPPNFKLLEKTTTTSATKKEKKKKTTKAPPKAKSTPRPKAKAPIQTKMKLKIAPKKISSAPRATAKASIGQKNILQTPSKSTQVSSPPTRTSPRVAATASNIARQQGTSSFSVLNNPFSKIESTPAHPSEVASPQTRSSYKRVKKVYYSQPTANPHPSPETVNRMEESAHPTQLCPSPPMPAASHTLTDTKVAAATNLLAVATTHIPLELPFESVGLRTRQQSQSSSEIATEPQTIAAIGDLSEGIDCKRVALPRKANKGATKKGATRKGANKKGEKDVGSKT